MNSGKVLLGLLAGVAAGALLGVLFAPEKGSITREKISQKGEDYADVLKEKFNDLIESVTQKISKVNDDISDFAEKDNSTAKGTERSVKSAIL